MIKLEQAVAIASLLITLVTGTLPLITSSTKSSVVETEAKAIDVSTQFIGPINPLLDLGDSGRLISISARVGTKQLDEIIIENAILKNTGTVPIRPEDTYEPLGLTVDSPWKIFAIVGLPGYIPAAWHQVTDQEFRADKMLLNPGEQIWATLYLTRPNSSSVIQDPPINPQWVARIAGLSEPELSPAVPSAAVIERGKKLLSVSWGVQVALTGWGVPFVLLFVGICELGYLAEFRLLGLLSPWKKTSYALVTGSVLLTVIAAEATSTLLIPSPMTVFAQVSYGLNLPCVILNIFGLAGFGVWTIVRGRTRRAL